jgi:hypothetical protein
MIYGPDFVKRPLREKSSEIMGQRYMRSKSPAPDARRGNEVDIGSVLLNKGGTK